ncbi:pyridoxal-phosphate dependent enzyme [Streptomyces sp. MMG1121]|uniref:pyridoxal-phosphate dependent enzyme n=1 Tax=Streptomyces sp. MMG1121 TaxID=1415544 RepID=UPI003B63BB91
MHLALPHRGKLIPASGSTIASGGNPSFARAWNAQQHGVRATVFVPENTPPVKVVRLRAYGAGVHQVGARIGEADRDHRLRVETFTCLVRWKSRVRRSAEPAAARRPARLESALSAPSPEQEYAHAPLRTDSGTQEPAGGR